MTDHELLEQAAKAAGFELEEWDYIMGMYLIESFGGDVIYWNPLTDDGDALRLAVKLELDVEFGLGGYAATYVSAYIDCEKICQVDEKHGDDSYAATRRAIVRAAAEIGKDMK